MTALEAKRAADAFNQDLFKKEQPKEKKKKWFW